MNKHRIAIAAIVLSIAAKGHAAPPPGDGKDFISKQTPAPATEEPWQFAITPYVWLPNIELDLALPAVSVGKRTFGGDMNTSIPLWDSINNVFSGKVFTISADGRLEFLKGRWGGFVDGYWIYARANGSSDASKLVLRDHVQLGGAVSATTKTEIGQVNFGPRYLLGTVPLSKAVDGPSVTFELYGGGRINWINTSLDGTVTLSAATVRRSRSRDIDFNSSAGRAYIEPMIGLRTTWNLTRNLIVMIRGDAGGFGLVADENWDCDLEAGFAWQFHKNILLDLGYRARGQWQNLGSPHDVSVKGWGYGPEIGVTFKF